MLSAAASLPSLPSHPYISLPLPPQSPSTPCIVLLNSYQLTRATPHPDVPTLLAHLPPSPAPLQLLYIHNPHHNPSPFSARPFFAAVASLPPPLLARVSAIAVLHPNAALRAALYILAPRDLYAKVALCDLVEDVERQLGIDSLLLRLPQNVLDADEEQRVWVGRHNPPKPRPLDPSKPLLNFESVDTSRPARPAEQQQQQGNPARSVDGTVDGLSGSSAGPGASSV